MKLSFHSKETVKQIFLSFKKKQINKFSFLCKETVKQFLTTLIQKYEYIAYYINL